MKIEAQVHMLPTDQVNPVSVPFTQTPSGKLIKHAAGGEFRKYLEMGFKPQHIYITVDGSLKSGDYGIHGNIGLFRCRGITPSGQIITDRRGLVGKSSAGKVVATTNYEFWGWSKSKSFKGVRFKIGKIPDDFMQEFVREQGKIDKVMIEVDEIEDFVICRNGTVSLSPYFQKSFTEKEVLAILENYDRMFKLDTMGYTKACSFTVSDWFNNNVLNK